VLPLHVRQLYAEMCRDSQRVALSVVTNSTYGLTLLHLPPPHTPGIYDPYKKQITIWPTVGGLGGGPRLPGYLNNLMLADRNLGELRRAMEQAGQWDKTWIIFSADHSWRLSRSYDGRRDLRVPFLVKPPGANESITYSPQFNTVLTHGLILAILRGEISHAQNVADWLDAHRSAQGNIPASDNQVE
jgi:hypothetical protein